MSEQQCRSSIQQAQQRSSNGMISCESTPGNLSLRTHETLSTQTLKGNEIGSETRYRSGLSRGTGWGSRYAGSKKRVVFSVTLGAPSSRAVIVEGITRGSFCIGCCNCGV